MATKEEVIEHVKSKLLQVYEESIDGPYVKGAITGTMDAATWTSIADNLKNRDFDSIGRLMGVKVRSKVVEDATAEAIQIVDDDLLSLDEYSRIESLL